MKITVNLASHPFVELRPLFAKLRVAMAGLVVLAIALGVSLHMMRKHAQVEQAQMTELKRQTSMVETERHAAEMRMREPQNRAVLDRSEFLNALFARKSFSWTAVMMDLERVLPAGVQVTSITPEIMAEGQVNIRLRVVGQRENAVDLVRNLERSQRFLGPRIVNETAQTQAQGRMVPAAQMSVPGGVEFEILSGYNPLPVTKAVEKEPPKKSAVATKKPAAKSAPAAAGATTAAKPLSIAKAAKAATPKPRATPKQSKPGTGPGVVH